MSHWLNDYMQFGLTGYHQGEKGASSQTCGVSMQLFAIGRALSSSWSAPSRWEGVAERWLRRMEASVSTA